MKLKRILFRLIATDDRFKLNYCLSARDIVKGEKKKKAWQIHFRGKSRKFGRVLACKSEYRGFNTRGLTNWRRVLN